MIERYQELQPFPQERAVGTVKQSRQSNMSVSLFPEALESGLLSIGEHVVVQSGVKAIFGTISSLVLQSDGPTASAELVASIDLMENRVTPGVAASPALGATVFVATAELVKFVVESQNKADSGVSLCLGTLPHSSQTQLRFTPERMFGRHLAIIGTSGSGKSWSTARIMEECTNLNAKLILFDATGEYYTLNQGCKHVYLGENPDPHPHETPISLPYFHLNESDLFGIFQPTGQSQAAKLRAAIESLKISRLAPHLAPDGTIIKAHKAKTDYQSECLRFAAQLEDPRALFDVGLLPFQIRHECVDSQRSPTEPHFWGGHNTVDYSYCVPLINRIQDIVRSPSLRPIFNPQNTRSILDEINLFMRDHRYQILRLSLRYLSFAYGTRPIVANAIGRHLMSLARDNSFKRKPLVILVDEAHQFLNNSITTAETDFPLDSFSLIAKEGRKYAINVVLATQRPRDIPEDVLSQMGTLLIHRLINDNDRSIVERASGEMDTGSAASIPVLASGTGILIGVDFPVPLSIKMLPPTSPPDSSGPDYQQYWARSVE